MNSFWNGFEKRAGIAQEAIRVGKGGVQLFGKREAIGASHLKEMAKTMPKVKPTTKNVTPVSTPKSRWFDERTTPRSIWNAATQS